MIRWIRSLLAICLTVLANIALAFDGFDECATFVSELSDGISSLKTEQEFPWEDEKSFGFNFHYGEEGEVPSRISKINSEVLDRLDVISEFLYGDIYSINGQKISDLDYSNFLEALNEENIKLELFSSEKEYEFQKDNFKVIDVFFEPEIETIYTIDPKKGKFDAKLSLSTWWIDGRLLSLARSIYQRGLQIDNNYLSRVNSDPDFSPGFQCTISYDVLKSLNFYVPNVVIGGFRPDIDQQDPDFNFIYEPETNNAGSLHSETVDGPTKLKKISDGAEALIVWKIEKFQGSFANSYNLEKFPFDTQVLNFSLSHEDNWVLTEGTVRINLGFLTDDSLDTALLYQNSNEWKYSAYNYDDSFTYSNWFRGQVPIYEFWFILDRNFEYYIYKLFLPIFLLLTLTWSIFWIDVRNLETRVTISIVTFLALIAYNFVIDNDLAKLAYLTFLDVVILVSYLFAGLPTLMAIYCNKKFIEEERIWAEKVNSVAKVSFPVGYMICLGFVYLFFELGFS